MREISSTALRWHQHQLFILNQQKLPQEEEWIHCQSPEHMRDLIQSLQVRGAPLIGIAAAFALAQFAEQGADLQSIKQAANLLKEARPTAVNLSFCIEKQLRQLDVTGDVHSIMHVAEQLFFEDVELCNHIAAHGYRLLADGDNILTHCNTGGLVTAGDGTALGVIFHAHRQNKAIHVYVDETRPLLQGARLTTWELNRRHVPYTLICDNMAATLMRAGKIQKVIVGADRIARNGDFANKIGTYNLAVLAKYHHIPFYVAAPYTTLDLTTLSGEAIIVEQRAKEEVLGVVQGSKSMVWSVETSMVFNPAFDVTPATLVTAFILDQGIYAPEDLTATLYATP